MTNLRTLHFYATPEHDCSYLQDREAKTLFVDPQAIIAKDTYSQLSDLGFRRSGRHIYRPHCNDCQACISVRIPSTEFQPSRSQKRVLSKNSDIKIRVVTPQFNQEYYELYSRYISSRHADGDMYPPSAEQFNSFLVDGDQESCFIEMRGPDNSLMAIAVTDYLENGLSAIYTFYDPDDTRRSLGTFAILAQIRHACHIGLPYVYLGYWVRECRKMSYKIAFRPSELLLDGHWVTIK
ncbi:arginyltransferase [Marinobacterium jannaschii]|uniref:arginyltransferase n=1 Tax=Marinobacterium jannaschii TaxID=64970 RepID=UPI0004855C19|nr:arginyltransferase [Marinobacterium jannaschii]